MKGITAAGLAAGALTTGIIVGVWLAPGREQLPFTPSLERRIRQGVYYLIRPEQRVADSVSAIERWGRVQPHLALRELGRHQEVTDCVLTLAVQRPIGPGVLTVTAEKWDGTPLETASVYDSAGFAVGQHIYVVLRDLQCDEFMGLGRYSWNIRSEMLERSTGLEPPADAADTSRSRSRRRE